MNSFIEQLKKESKTILSGMGVKTGQESIIGLDIGTSEFRAVRVKSGIKEIPLKDIVVGAVDWIKDLPGKMNISPDEKVSVNFSRDSLAVLRAEVPVMPKDEIEEALRWELKDQVHFDISKAKIKFEILGERESEDGARKTELIAIVYKEKDIEDKVNELRSLGLNVQAVLPSDIALNTYAQHLDIAPCDEKIAIVDIGRIKTAINIIENNRLYFSRDLPIGGDSITEAMTGVLGSDKGRIELSKEEAEKIKREQGIPSDIRILSMMRPVLERLSNEIKRSLEYCEHRFKSISIKKIILAGNGSKLKGLNEYLTKHSGLEVLGALPENACAIGLALAADSSLNMIPERFKLEKNAALKKISLRMASFVALVLFFVSYGFLSAKTINVKNELKIYRSYWESIKDIKSIKDRMTIFGHAINSVSYRDVRPGKIMKEISNLAPSYVMLEDMVIKKAESNVKLSGIILREDKLSEFMALLENSIMFENVKLVLSEKNENHSSGALDFEIICNITQP